MPVSRRTKLKTEEFDRNIKRRGAVKLSERTETRLNPKLGPVVLGFFVFVVCGSAVLELIQAGSKGRPAV